MPTYDPKSTALVLIDMQDGIVSLPLAPASGADIAHRAIATASRFRSAGSQVVLVRVSFAADFADALNQDVDNPLGGSEPPAAGWDALVPGLAQEGDILLTKRQWGAFYGTELDLQLRRRGIKTVVIGGIATNFGVESTARTACELGYAVVVPKDLCSSFSDEIHKMAVEQIFPRLGRVVLSDEIRFLAE
jgi:nicotinamidase-related amidase